MILDELAALRADFAHCKTVALADISSGTVLCVSSQNKHPQERMDALCSAAAELLDGDAAHAFSKAVAMPTGAATHECVVMSKTQTYIFLRSPQDHLEALFCVCAPDIDIDSFLTSARSRLKTIATEQ